MKSQEFRLQRTMRMPMATEQVKTGEGTTRSRLEAFLARRRDRVVDFSFFKLHYPWVLVSDIAVWSSWIAFFVCLPWAAYFLSKAA